jgi:hypothetical protein
VRLTRLIAGSFVFIGERMLAGPDESETRMSAPPRRFGMKRKILLAILLLLIASQIPFAYRRYRLYKLHAAIQQLATLRTPIAGDNQYVDYKGVIHVHSFLGGHSTGTFSELIAAAKTNQLDFVIMTEHPQPNFDTAAMTLNGLHDGVLFVNGNEVATSNGDRLLLIPGAADAASDSSRGTQEIVDQQKRNGGLAFVAYPSESQNWTSTSPDGIEIYNLFTNAKQIRPVVMFFDGLWSYRSYADLMFANFFSRPQANLERWDAEMRAADHNLVAIAGNDAHSNVGLSLNDAGGNSLVGLKLDPYERGFRVVRTHVLLKQGEPLTRESLLAALARGHCYISFDIFADPTGFSFVAGDPQGNEGSRAIMGESFNARDETILTIQAPIPARIVLYRDGQRVNANVGTSVKFLANEPGTYRVEAYLQNMPPPSNDEPWIISNPIHLSLFSLSAGPKSGDKQ